MDLKVTREGAKVVVLLSGRVDVPGSENLRKALFQIAEADSKEVVLDFQQVPSIGSSGIGALILFHEKFTASGGKIKIINVSDEIRSLFDIIKLDTLFDF